MSDQGGGAVCGQCGTTIVDDSPNCDLEDRKPCPKCGFKGRVLSASIVEGVGLSAEIQTQVVTYPQALLVVARGLIDIHQFGIAVVVAHMACEIAVERRLSKSFVDRGVAYLEDAVTDLLNGYNLANDRIRKLYTALTGDDVHREPFWANFRQSASRRNGVVHQGAIIGEVEAEESFKVASDLVAHVSKV